MWVPFTPQRGTCDLAPTTYCYLCIYSTLAIHLPKPLMRYLFCLLLAICATTLTAQTTADDYVKQGIELHDAGNYTAAIAAYEKALELKPNWALANYEIALSYHAAGELKQAVKYTDKVLKAAEESNYLLSAYIVKGSALDDMGKSKKSIKVFNEALERMGEHYLLRFNLALDYFREGNLQLAAESAGKAIDHNYEHGSSHLLLANIQATMGHRSQTALAALFFLLLEDDTPRATEARGLVNSAMGGGNVQRGPNGNIQLTLSTEALTSGFGMSDMLLDMKLAQVVADSAGVEMTQLEKTLASTKLVFDIISEKEGATADVWGGFYAPFFGSLHAAGHTEAFFYLVMADDEGEAAAWLEGHGDAVAAFEGWMSAE